VNAACPALVIAAPASGQGKTTVTAALAAYHRKRGRRVRIFKIGPDFLDPMILEHASGNPVYQLDLWMGGEAHCRDQLHQAAQQADLILAEGAMGLFDGHPSAADFAATFDLPVLAVFDTRGMAQTFAALAFGMSALRSDVKIVGVFANRVGSERHRTLLEEYLPANLPLYGWMPRAADIALPERHLGLQQAAEIDDLAARIDRAADALRLTHLQLPPSIAFPAPQSASPPPLLQGTKIAVARDAAFAFLYQVNLDLLRALGAQLEFFSPLADQAMPEADALYLPGGYPELHLAPLAANQAMQQSIRDHHARGKPILAECGGMLYLLDSLTDDAGERATMVGLLPGQAALQKRMANLGMYSVSLPEGTLRGHSFHYSRMETTLEPIAQAVGQPGTRHSEPAYRVGRLHASYLHHYFPSNPEAVAHLFKPSK
jgi:cobyrinic acid a,c-diamide synthase